MTRPYPEFSIHVPGALAPGFDGAAAQRRARDHGSSRFVTESHSLGAPAATPQGIVVALAVAVAVFLIGRRLSA